MKNSSWLPALSYSEPSKPAVFRQQSESAITINSFFHSCLNASTGGNSAAFRAGYKPAAIPAIASEPIGRKCRCWNNPRRVKALGRWQHRQQSHETGGDGQPDAAAESGEECSFHEKLGQDGAIGRAQSLA